MNLLAEIEQTVNKYKPQLTGIVLSTIITVSLNMNFFETFLFTVATLFVLDFFHKWLCVGKNL